MLIFGTDDNDDNLELDFDGKHKQTPQTPPTPPVSSLPTRPAPRSPFGSNSDQVENLVPEKKSQRLPERPSSPFGQPAPAATNSRLPQKPVPAFKKPERPVTENAEAPVVPEPKTPVVQAYPAPSVPDVSTYLPPVRQPEPVQPELLAEPEVLSESELFLRTMQEHSQQRAEAAKAEAEAAKKTPEALPNTVTPKVPVETGTTPVVEPVKGKEPVKKKQGFFTPPPKKESKKSTAQKAPREHKYDGDRKKILYIRLIAGTVAAIVGIAGLNAIFNPNTGPTKEMVQSAAKQAVNYTGFPTASGEQFALDFTKAYFNYDSSSSTDSRETSLERFASPDLIKQIDVQKLSPSEYESIKKSGISYNDYVVSQNISYGPYVVATNNVTAEYALFTVKVGLKSGTVLYYDVPVKYNPQKYSLTLAGPPSFSKPIDNTDAAAPDEWTVKFDGGSDSKLEESQLKDMEAYFKAWGESDDTILNLYVLPTATDNAKRGLQKSVQFNKVIDLKIEPENADVPTTATQRRVEVNVLWEDPKTNIRYPQQYRMLIALNKENKWAVYDIQNFVTLNGSK
jgi:hypothetical protein